MAVDDDDYARIELESKIAFQEKALADLNAILSANTRTILDLQRRVQILENITRGFNRRLEGFSEAPPDEKPPHY
jgi:uncharacterized coiled-coil protein SlyX